jgi:hypothetical protein
VGCPTSGFVLEKDDSEIVREYDWTETVTGR